MKQKEQLAAQEQKLEELTLKIEDVETLLDDVSDAAYAIPSGRRRTRKIFV